MDPSWAPAPMAPPPVPTTTSEVASEESTEPPRRCSAEEDSRAMAKIAAELKRFAEVDSKGKAIPAEIQKQPQEDSEYDAHLFQTIREEYRQSTEDAAFQKQEDQQEMFQYPIIHREASAADSSTFLEAPPHSTSSSLPSSSLPSSLASPEIHGLPILDQKPARRSNGNRKPRPRGQNLTCTGCKKSLGSDYALRRHRMSCAEVQKQRNPEYPKPPKRKQSRTALDMDQEELQSEEETPVVEIVKAKRKRVSKIAAMSKEEREHMCAEAERRMFEAEREIEMMEAMPAPSVVMDTVDELQMERDAMNLHKSPPTTNFTGAEPTNLHNSTYYSRSSTNTTSRESSSSISPPSKVPSEVASSEISSSFATSSEAMSSESSASSAGMYQIPM